MLPPQGAELCQPPGWALSPEPAGAPTLTPAPESPGGDPGRMAQTWVLRTASQLTHTGCWAAGPLVVCRVMGERQQRARPSCRNRVRVASKAGGVYIRLLTETANRWRPVSASARAAGVWGPCVRFRRSSPPLGTGPGLMAPHRPPARLAGERVTPAPSGVRPGRRSDPILQPLSVARRR